MTREGRITGEDKNNNRNVLGIPSNRIYYKDGNEGKYGNHVAKSDFDKEHTTTFIRNNPNLFKIINHEHSKSNLFKKHRWCLDFEDDYLFIKFNTINYGLLIKV